MKILSKNIRNKIIKDLEKTDSWSEVEKKYENFKDYLPIKYKDKRGNIVHLFMESGVVICKRFFYFEYKPLSE